jgi:cytokinesis protein
MLGFSTEKKWLMVSQDKQTDIAAPVPSATYSTSSNKEVDKNSPDYYIDTFMEPDMRGVTPRLVAHLAVSLRTMPLR